MQAEKINEVILSVNKEEMSLQQFLKRSVVDDLEINLEELQLVADLRIGQRMTVGLSNLIRLQ